MLKTSVRVLLNKDRSNRGVGQTSPAMHNRLAKAHSDTLASRIEIKLSDHHQSIDLWIQRTDAVAQSLGKHRQTGTGEVDAGAAFKSLLVDHTANGNVMSNISNRYPETVALSAPRNGDRVIEIFRCFTINRHEIHMTQVFASGDILVRNLQRNSACRGEHFSRKFIRQAELDGRNLDLNFRIGRVTNDFSDATNSATRATRIVFNIDQDHLPLTSASGGAGRDQDVILKTGINRSNITDSMLQLISANESSMRPLLNTNHTTFGLSGTCRSFQAHNHHVAMHRRTKMASGNKNILGVLISRGNKTITVAVHGDRTNNKVNLMRQGKLPPFQLHQGAVPNHVFQALAEQLALTSVQIKHRLELFKVQRTIGTLLQ